MGFHLPVGYHENPGPVYFLDDPTADRGIVFQPDVYTLAEYLAELTGGGALGPPAIVDVGCGWGDKLALMHDRHPGWTFHGVDYGANIARCRQAWPWGSWVEHDLETFVALDADEAIVICSDVIEHLVDPLPLIASLRASGAAAIVLSTPERDVQHGYDHRGPSPNLCHVREWNAHELHVLLEEHGLRIRHHGLTRGSDQGWPMATQLVVAEPAS